MMEQPEAGQQDLDNNLTKVLHRYYFENSSEYLELHESIIRNCLTPKKAMELLAPAGIAVKTVRIAGIGKLMLSIKGENQELELVNLRSDNREFYSWASCVAALMQLGGNDEEASKDWAIVYGKPYPEKKEIAPAQVEEKDKRAEVVKPAITERKKTEPLNKTDAGKSAKPEPMIPDEPETVPDENDRDDNNDNISSAVTTDKENHEPEDIEIVSPNLASDEDNQSDVTEIIENPYQDLRKMALVLIERTREHLQMNEFDAAYKSGKELMVTLGDIMDVKRQQDEQIDEQMEIGDYTE